MKKFLNVAVLVIVVLVVGYVLSASHLYLRWRRNVDNTTAAAQRCYVGHSRYDDWHAKLSIPYTSPTPAGIWAERFRKIQVSDSAGDVVRTMGEPDYVQSDVSKDGDRFIGCSWTYNVKVLDDDANYKTNSWIELFFNPENKLDDKDAVNIADIKNRSLSKTDGVNQ